jgi:hypothetical protein
MTTSWIQFAGAVAYAALVFFGPGYLAFRSLRFNRIDSLCFAPLASLCAYGVLEALLYAMGMPSSSSVVLAFPAIVFAVAAAISLACAARRNAHAGRNASRPRAARRASWLQLLAYVTVGMLYAASVYLLTLASPDSFIQAFDNAHHLNLARSMLASGNWSSLDTTLTPGTGGSYYPATWSALAAMAAQATGASIPAAGNAVNAVCIAFVFPTATYAFLSRLFDGKGARIICGALLFLAFTAIPWMQLRYGPLYPNMLGFVVSPAVFALFLDATAIAAAPRSKARATVGFLVGACAVALCHPSAFFTVAVFLAPAMLHFIFGLIDGKLGPSWKRPASKAVAAALFLGACIILWVFLHDLPVMSNIVNFEYGAQASPARSVLYAALLHYPHFWYQLPLALLVAAGFATCCKERNLRWLAASYLLLCTLYVLNMSLEAGPLKSYLTGFWYNHATRLAASAALAAIPLAALGLERISAWVAGRIGGSAVTLRGKHAAWATDAKPAHPLNGKTIAICALALALVTASPVTITASGMGKAPMGVMWSRLRTANAEESGRAILRPDERAFVQRATQMAADGQEIMNNPYDGSVFAYALYGTNIHLRSFSTPDDSDEALIREHLRDIAQNGDVAAAVKREHLEYVLVLDADHEDEKTLYWNTYEAKDWAGIDSIADDTPGFEVVLAQDDMRLYRIGADQAPAD